MRPPLRSTTDEGGWFLLLLRSALRIAAVSWISADHGVLVESPKFGGNCKRCNCFGYISPVRPKVGLWRALVATRAQDAGGWLGSCKGDREMAGSSPSLDEIGLLLQQKASLGEHPDSPVRTFLTGTSPGSRIAPVG